MSCSRPGGTIWRFGLNLGSTDGLIMGMKSHSRMGMRRVALSRRAVHQVVHPASLHRWALLPKRAPLAKPFRAMSKHLTTCIAASEPVGGQDTRDDVDVQVCTDSSRLAVRADERASLLLPQDPEDPSVDEMLRSGDLATELLFGSVPSCTVVGDGVYKCRGHKLKLLDMELLPTLTFQVDEHPEGEPVITIQLLDAQFDTIDGWGRALDLDSVVKVNAACFLSWKGVNVSAALEMAQVSAAAEVEVLVNLPPGLKDSHRPAAMGAACKLSVTDFLLPSLHTLLDRVKDAHSQFKLRRVAPTFSRSLPSTTSSADSFTGPRVQWPGASKRTSNNMNNKLSKNKGDKGKETNRGNVDSDSSVSSRTAAWNDPKSQGPQDFIAISKEQEEKLALMLEKLQEYSVSLEQQAANLESRLLKTIREKESLEARMGNMEQLSQTVDSLSEQVEARQALLDQREEEMQQLRAELDQKTEELQALLEDRHETYVAEQARKEMRAIVSQLESKVLAAREEEQAAFEAEVARIRERSSADLRKLEGEWRSKMGAMNAANARMLQSQQQAHTAELKRLIAENSAVRKAEEEEAEEAEKDAAQVEQKLHVAESRLNQTRHEAAALRAKIGEVEARAQRDIARLVTQHAAEVETMEGCARDMAKLADRWKQCASEAETRREEEVARERDSRQREIAELQEQFRAQLEAAEDAKVTALEAMKAQNQEEMEQVQEGWRIKMEDEQAKRVQLECQISEMGETSASKSKALSEAQSELTQSKAQTEQLSNQLEEMRTLLAVREAETLDNLQSSERLLKEQRELVVQIQSEFKAELQGATAQLEAAEAAAEELRDQLRQETSLREELEEQMSTQYWEVPTGIRSLRESFSRLSGQSEEESASDGQVAAAGVATKKFEQTLTGTVKRRSGEEDGLSSGWGLKVGKMSIPDIVSDRTWEEGAWVQLKVATSSIPYPDKDEDASFILEPGVHGGSMGICDGVSGWAKAGLTSAAGYAQEFTKYLQGWVDRMGEGQPVDLREALRVAHDNTKVPGSCTVCLAVMQPKSNKLLVAVLGDCGIRVIRNKRVAYASEIQEWEPNMPYQFGCPELMPATCYPKNAVLLEVEVQEGDVVVMGSDGLFDNCFDEDIAAVVEDNLLAPEVAGSALALRKTSDALAAQAKEYSLDTQCITPFSDRYSRNEAEKRKRDLRTLLQRQKDKVYTGGKPDDITVAVALITAVDRPVE